MVLFTDKATKKGKNIKKESPAGLAGDNSDLSYSLIQVKPKPYHEQNWNIFLKF